MTLYWTRELCLKRTSVHRPKGTYSTISPFLYHAYKGKVGERGLFEGVPQSTVQREYTQYMMYECDISSQKSGIEIEKHFAVSNCSA